MSNYSPIVNYAAKDALASGDPLKRIKGTEISAEFTSIATMSTTKADLASPTFTGTPSSPTAAAGTNTTQIATTGFTYLAIANLITGITGVNGWILSAANTPALYSNSVQRATVSSTGMITINAPTSGIALTVNGVAGASLFKLVPAAGTNWIDVNDGTTNFVGTFSGASSYIGNASNHAVILRTNNVDRLTLAAAGNITVGTPTSGNALTLNHIAGSVAVFTTDGTTQGVLITNSTNLDFGAFSNHALRLLTNNTSRVTIAAAGNITIAAPSSGVALTVAGVSGTHSTKIADSATNSFNAGFLEVPQNTQNANYTTVLADSGKQIYHSSGSPHTYTIDSNANVAYPLGTVLTFINDNGGGTVTIALTSDTLRFIPGGTTGSRTLAANGRATAIKMTSTSWQISGTNLT